MKQASSRYDFSEKVLACLHAEAQSVSRLYKIDVDSAFDMFADSLSGQPTIIELIEETLDLASLRRKKAYRSFVKAVRKKIYNQLRTYYADSAIVEDVSKEFHEAIEAGEASRVETLKNQLLETHASTRERSDYVSVFNEKILEYTRGALSIIDIGSGLYPLSFPFKQHEKLKRYVCIEKDPRAVEVLNSYARTLSNTQLIAHEKNIHELDTWLANNERDTVFDVAFMFKLIPVIDRQEEELLEILARVNAHYVIVTGSKEALTRREDITDKDRRRIKKFIKLTDKKIVDTFVIGNEFGFLLK